MSGKDEKEIGGYEAPADEFNDDNADAEDAQPISSKFAKKVVNELYERYNTLVHHPQGSLFHPNPPAAVARRAAGATSAAKCRLGLPGGAPGACTCAGKRMRGCVTAYGSICCVGARRWTAPGHASESAMLGFRLTPPSSPVCLAARAPIGVQGPALFPHLRLFQPQVPALAIPLTLIARHDVRRSKLIDSPRVCNAASCTCSATPPMRTPWCRPFATRRRSSPGCVAAATFSVLGRACLRVGLGVGGGMVTAISKHISLDAPCSL